MRSVLLILPLLLLAAAPRAQTPGVLPENGTVRGTLSAASDTLDDGRFVARYALGVTTTNPFEVRLTSDDFDPYLIVSALDGDDLENDDFEGSEEESRIVVAGRADALGSWSVRVTTSEPGEVGTYRLEHRVMTAEEAVRAAERQRRLASADSLASREEALWASGRYAEAIPLARKYAAIREAVLGPDHPVVATSLNNLAELHRVQGAYEAARLLHERAFAIREATLGPDHPYVAQSLNNLAGLLLEQYGDFSAARPLYERALTINEKAHGAGHPDVAGTLGNLANLLMAQGDYEAARPLYERALTINEAALGADHPAVAGNLNNLAMLLFKQGDFSAARPLLERALTTKKETLGADHPAVATSLGNLAALLRAQGDFAAARPLIERALAIREAALGANHPDVALSLGNLAGLLFKQYGDFAAAQPLIERALAIREAALGANHPDVALSLNDLAELLRAQGDYEAARPIHERALTIYEAALGPDHPLVAGSLNNLAALLEAQGDFAAARPFRQRAARIYDRLTERVLPTLAAAEQRAFVEVDLGEQTAALLSSHRAEDDLRAAYALFGGWKGLLLREMRRQTAITALADDPEHADDVAELQALRTRVARAYRNSDPTLSDLTEEKEVLERRLASALPGDATEDPWRALGEDGLQAALPAGSAFADLFRYGYWERGEFAETRYAAVVSSPGADPVLVDLGTSDRLDDLVAAWREAVTAGAPALVETEALVDTAWQPIAEALPEGTTRLWVSPDAQLARLSWATLAAEASPTASQGSTPDLLVAEVASGRALARLLSEPLTEPVAATGGGDLLLVGGVDFGSGDAGWAALPGTEREAERIAALAQAEGLDARVLAAATPTPEAVAEALPTAAYAHLATHGFFFQETEAAYASRGERSGVEPVSSPTSAASYQRNPLVESGLALAGANTGPEGHLTAEELVGLDLSGTRLVVLSACDTGRGREITGQGVMGLRASLEAAGAGAVLMSLWKVPDESTALLMETFYRGLWAEGLAPAEALRQAQAVVRSDPRYGAPVHWAAWVLAGRAW